MLKLSLGMLEAELKTRTSVPDLEKPDGTTSVIKRRQKFFNDFFRSVFTKENLGKIPEIQARYVKNLLQNLRIATKLVLQKVQALKPNKSPGPDNLHSRAFIEVANEIAEPLAIIMQKSLEEGFLPGGGGTIYIFGTGT